MPDTFEGLATYVFKSLPALETTHFLTDTYKHQTTGAIAAWIHANILAWKQQNTTAEGLQGLLKLLEERQIEWYAPLLKDHNVFYVCGSLCMYLHSADGKRVCDIYTRVEFKSWGSWYTDCSALSTRSWHNGIGRRPCGAFSRHWCLHTACPLLCQDSQQTVHGQWMRQTHRRVLDIHLCANKLGRDVCRALPALHAFTECDSTSSFVSHWDAFRRLGLVGNHITDDTVSALQQFVCAMYGKPSSSNVNHVRYKLFTSHSDLKPYTKFLAAATHTGVDLSLIPPCRLSLHKHCQRVN